MNRKEILIASAVIVLVLAGLVALGGALSETPLLPGWFSASVRDNKRPPPRQTTPMSRQQNSAADRAGNAPGVPHEAATSGENSAPASSKDIAGAASADAFGTELPANGRASTSSRGGAAAKKSPPGQRGETPAAGRRGLSGVANDSRARGEAESEKAASASERPRAGEGENPVYPGRIAGVVLSDDDGRPITEFQMALLDAAAGDAVLAELSIGDEDGRFLITNLRDGRYRLRAWTRTRLPADSPVVVVESGGAVEDISLSLSAVGATVRGVVVDRADSRPLSGALVFVDDSGARSVTHTPGAPIEGAVLTGEDGAYVLKRVPAGEHVIGALADGRAYATRRDVRAENGATISGVDFVLERGVWLSGTVTGPGGQPAPGVVITAATRREELRRVKTGRDGRYRIHHLAAGAYTITARLRRSGRVLARTRKLNLGARRKATLDFSFKPGSGEAAISGVVTRGQKPKGGVRLVLRRLDKKQTVRLRATSGADGAYRFSALRPGIYALDVARMRFRLKVSEDAPETFQDVELPSTVAGGYVLDGSAGTPVRGAKVIMVFSGDFRGDPKRARRSATTGEDGYWFIADLPGGTWRVTAEKAGYTRTVLNGVHVLSEGETSGLDIVLSRGISLSGVVRDENGGLVADAVVEVFGLDGKRIARTRTDRLGRYQFRGLKADAMDAFARKTGYARAGPAPVRVSAGEGAVLDFTLAAEAVLRVRVRDNRGGLAGGARVVLESTSGQRISRGTKAGEVLVIRGLAEDAYRVTITRKGFLPVVMDSLLLQKGQTEIITVRLEKRGR